MCHGDHNDAVHRVCKISADGRHVIKSYGGVVGSPFRTYSMYRHLAVDNNEFVFVVDVYNRLVTLLSPTLEYVREVVLRDDLKWRPDRMCLDIHRRRLYVADNEQTSKRVVVFSV